MSIIIAPQEVNEVVSIFDFSDFEFYLTGSRFFGNVRADSDWDFFVEDSEEVRSFLDFHGFEKKRNGVDYYLDKNTVTVMFLKVDNIEIQVQLILDVRKKVLAQEILYMTRELQNCQFKNQRTIIWNKTFAILDLLEKLKM